MTRLVLMALVCLGRKSMEGQVMIFLISAQQMLLRAMKSTAAQATMLY